MTQPSDEPPPTAAAPVPARIEADKLKYRTDELFQGRREVWLEHGDEQYRLRITSTGKLLLTK